MSREARARLLHDVGKYVARTARNLTGEPSAALIGMLARDLYELEPGRRASQVLDALSVEIAGAEVARARGLLLEADGFEAQLRAGEPAAVSRGAAIACEVEHLLRELARRPA